MPRSTFRSVALTGMLVAGLFAVSQSSEASEAQAQPEREPTVPAGCPLAKIAATPQCNYLAKCCAGGGENAQKCCQGYLKVCGRD